VIDADASSRKSHDTLAAPLGAMSHSLQEVVERAAHPLAWSGVRSAMPLRQADQDRRLADEIALVPRLSVVALVVSPPPHPGSVLRALALRTAAYQFLSLLEASSVHSLRPTAPEDLSTHQRLAAATAESLLSSPLDSQRHFHYFLAMGSPMPVGMALGLEHRLAVPPRRVPLARMRPRAVPLHRFPEPAALQMECCLWRSATGLDDWLFAMDSLGLAGDYQRLSVDRSATYHLPMASADGPGRSH